MIISHKYRFIFLKTTKTAGTSVEIALSRFCGPEDIITPISPVERIDVDISALKRPGEGIRVRAVPVSDKIRILNDADTMVAVATFAKVEEEVAAVPGAEAVTPTPTEPELSVERGKKEEEGEE